MSVHRILAGVLAGLLLLSGCGRETDIFESKPLYSETHPVAVASELMPEEPALTAEERISLEANRAMFRMIYEVDPGLNSGISIIAVDAAEMQNLPDKVKEVFLASLAEDYGCEIVEGNFESLLEAGYLTTSKGTSQNAFSHFDNGIIVSILDEPREGNTLRFAVEKWRGPLGAVYISDCLLTLEKEGWKVTEQGPTAMA